MRKLNRKVILGIVAVVLVTFFVGVATTSIWKLRENTHSNSGTPNVLQSPQIIKGVQVPDGWYARKTQGFEGASTVLTRTEDPLTATAEQIEISLMETLLTPEDFIPRQGIVGGSLDSQSSQWGWGVYQGHKTFSMTLAYGGVQQWFAYLFGGDKVYQFRFSPNDQTNPNLVQDRISFWEVITYYARDTSFEKLSREETQQNCKTEILPESQENIVQAEPETGYVAISTTKENKKEYIFLNFNDDLSQCMPGIKQLLSNIKTSMGKRGFSSK